MKLEIEIRDIERYFNAVGGDVAGISVETVVGIIVMAAEFAARIKAEQTAQKKRNEEHK